MKIFNRTNKKNCNQKVKLDFSKKLINDNRHLLWLVNIGGVLLAFYCVYKDYIGGLGWIAGMVSCAWAAHGTICSWYFNMAKSDHRSSDGTGITFAAAEANGFNNNDDNDKWESPVI